MTVALDSPYVVQSTDGLSVSILATRGLEITGAWFAGVPLHWKGETSDVYPDNAWLAGFTQSLVTTCGLNNVGSPSEGYPLHGDIALIPATEVTVRQDDDKTVVGGTITDGSFDLVRTITVEPRSGSLLIEDVVTNHGTERLQAPLLYHVNWGKPFLGPELTIDGNVASTVSRDGFPFTADWRRPFESIETAELVLEHEIRPDAQGWRALTLTNFPLGIAARVSWTGLDRVHEWIALHCGAAVVATEPANCSVLGREHDREVGNAPYLAAGEVRQTQLLIQVGRA